jgi:hypothetical protein
MTWKRRIKALRFVRSALPAPVSRAKKNQGKSEVMFILVAEKIGSRDNPHCISLQ